MGRAGLAALVLGVAAAMPAAAQDIITTEQLAARLISEQAVVRPGDSIHIALHQAVVPGWHTYWRNPGDSGQAPRIVWQLPEGAAAAEPQWPAPHRIPFGPLVNYGYSDATSLLTEISVPAGWTAGTPFPVAAKAELLVCSDICIPVGGRLSLTVPTGAQTIAAAEHAPLFAAARARLPAASPWPATFRVAGGRLLLDLAGDRKEFAAVTDAYFFADAWGVADHLGAQSATHTDAGLTVAIPRGKGAPRGAVSGVLALTEQTDAGPVRRAFAITAAPAAPGSGTPPAPATETTGLPLLLLFALLGGSILNLMPCVFPVLAVKALGLAGQAGANPRVRIGHGLSYTGGVVASFLGLAGLLLAARAGGAAVGWGFQLQNPLVVGSLAYVATAIGLNLSGVFEISNRLAGTVSDWASASGHAGSFATGVLAAVVAAPCTAPFMAAAAGGAMLLPAPEALAIFAAMGLGLALPYLLLAAAPPLARMMPKPGRWMVRFRQALAFPMYATAAWLIWVLTQQAGPDAALMTMLGLILFAAGLWLWPAAMPRVGGVAGKLRIAGFLVALIGAGGLLTSATSQSTKAGRAGETAGIAEPFSTARLDQLRAEGRPVLVNITAAWCISCKVNERVALSGRHFDAAMKRHSAAYLRGDWTNQDPEITAFLKRFGRAGVPLYVLFAAEGGAPQVLPQILDPGAVRRALETAAPPGAARHATNRG